MTIWTVAVQASLSMGFPRQECWSGLLSPSPRDLPESVTEPVSPTLAGGFFTTASPEKHIHTVHYNIYIIYHTTYNYYNIYA